MTQKTETPAEPKAATEAKNGSEKPTVTKGAPPEQQKPLSGAGPGATGTLSPELIELVTELRDTVKRIDPRRHTQKTLRRSLSNVSDILADIEQLYSAD